MVASSRRATAQASASRPIRTAGNYGRYQLFSRRCSSGRRIADASVDGEAAIPKGEHGVQVQLGHGRQIVTQSGETVDEVDERRRHPPAGRRGSRARVALPCRR